MAQLEIFGVPQSSLVWAVRLAAEEKGVPHTLHPERPHSDAVRAIHPLGKIPAMRHAAVTLGESRAIVQYIDGAFEGPSLAPRAPRDEMWVSMALTHFDPVLVRQYLFAYLFPGTEDGAPNAERAAAALPAVQAAYSILNRGAAHGEILGERLALPDLWLTPILAYMAKLPEWETATDGCQALRDGVDRALRRPATIATDPPPLKS